jgi:hypothetical protein
MGEALSSTPSTAKIEKRNSRIEERNTITDKKFLTDRFKNR